MVRVTRADVRLVFHPDSQAAELSRQVLEHLRSSLESAEHYYFRFDCQSDPTAWRQSQEGINLRQKYKYDRMRAYASLDQFFEEVSIRLAKPRWRTAVSPHSASERTLGGLPVQTVRKFKLVMWVRVLDPALYVPDHAAALRLNFDPG